MIHNLFVPIELPEVTLDLTPGVGYSEIFELAEANRVVIFTRGIAKKKGLSYFKAKLTGVYATEKGTLFDTASMINPMLLDGIVHIHNWRFFGLHDAWQAKILREEFETYEKKPWFPMLLTAWDRVSKEIEALNGQPSLRQQERFLITLARASDVAAGTTRKRFEPVAYSTLLDHAVWLVYPSENYVQSAHLWVNPKGENR